MPSWPSIRLSDACESVDYGYTAPASLIPTGYRFLRITDIVHGPPDWDGVPYCDIEPRQASRYALQHGDIVIARTGATTGVSAYIRQPPPAVFASYLVRLRARPAVNSRFLSYVLRGPKYSEFVASVAHAKSAQPNASAATLTQFEFDLPATAEQAAVAGLLGALDDKIQVNRRTSRNLEDLAAALFAHHFPYDPEDPLPDGWQIGGIESIATMSRGTVNPAETPEKDFDHYSIPAFDQAQLPVTEPGAGILSNKWSVPEGVVLVSKLNPRIPRVWFPRLEPARRSICSTEFFPLLPRPGVTAEFLYCLCTSPAFTDEFATLTTGTSGSHQRVRPDFMTAMEIAVPPPPVIEQFTATVRPLLDQVKSNREESRTLAALRDALLPKLLSGEIRVPQAERLVGATT